MLVLALLCAMTVCAPAFAGGVYKPEVEMVPTVELPPTMPSTVHVIPVFVVPETVTLNCCFCFKVSGARRGKMVTVTAATDESVRLKIANTRGSLRAAYGMAIRTSQMDRLLNSVTEFNKRSIWEVRIDRKSTRLNSSHTVSSYAVLC